jgi:hypothetical protein
MERSIHLQCVFASFIRLMFMTRDKYANTSKSVHRITILSNNTIYVNTLTLRGVVSKSSHTLLEDPSRTKEPQIKSPPPPHSRNY